MRSVEEILATGAAWVTESELERLCALARLCAEQHEALAALSQMKFLSDEQVAEADPEWTAMLDVTCGDVQRARAVLHKFAALGEPAAIGEEGGA